MLAPQNADYATYFICIFKMNKSFLPLVYLVYYPISLAEYELIEADNFSIQPCLHRLLETFNTTEYAHHHCHITALVLILFSLSSVDPIPLKTCAKLI